MKSSWKITIKERKETETVRNYEVIVHGIEDRYVFDVEVDKDYAVTVFEKNVPTTLLLQHSFMFLLEKEPVTSILKSFNLKEIQDNFIDYETAMKKFF